MPFCMQRDDAIWCPDCKFVESWIPVIWQIFINNVRENLHRSVAALVLGDIRFDFKANTEERRRKGVLSYVSCIRNKAMITCRESWKQTTVEGVAKRNRRIGVSVNARTIKQNPKSAMCDLFWNVIKLGLEFYRREPINNRKIAGWLSPVEYNPIEAQLRKTNQYTYCIRVYLLSSRHSILIFLCTQ